MGRTLLRRRLNAQLLEARTDLLVTKEEVQHRGLNVGIGEAPLLGEVNCDIAQDPLGVGGLDGAHDVLRDRAQRRLGGGWRGRHTAQGQHDAECDTAKRHEGCEYNHPVRSCLLALFAKAPRPGEVKTRLVPPLTLEQAAELYEAMLRDILEQHAETTEFDLALGFTPADAAGWFRRVAPPSYRLEVQQGATLGERMCGLFSHYTEAGYERIVLRGTDAPTLPAVRISEAFAALGRADLVLCPDLDGGYSLIGLRRRCDALFELALSRGDVLRETLARAHQAGLRSEVLSPHYDVDRGADLERLARDPAAKSAPRTFAWLEEWSRVRGSMGA